MQALTLSGRSQLDKPRLLPPKSESAVTPISPSGEIHRTTVSRVIMDALQPTDFPTVCCLPNVWRRSYHNCRSG